MEAEHASVVPVAPLIDKDPATPPAPGAEENKPIPPEGEAPPETAAETTEQQEAKKQSKFQRRLDRHKTARIEAETRAKILQEERDRLQAKLDAQGRQAQETGEPKETDYADYTQYTRALARWEASQVVQAERKAEAEARASKEKQQEANAGTQKIADAWAEAEKAFQAETKDYAEVVEEFTGEGGEVQSLSKQARIAIAELGPALLYHLAKNPEIVSDLAELSPVRQVAELGKLEGKLEKAPKGKTISTAPAPIKPASGGNSTPTGYRENMTTAEYDAWKKSLKH